MNKNIIYNKMKLSWLVLPLLVLFSCTDDYMEINTDETKFMKLTAKEYGELFFRAQHKGIAWQTTDDGSRMHSTHVSHYCGYTACGIYAYDQNQMRASWERAGFQDIYVDALPCLISMMEVAEEAGDVGVYNLALIWKVFLFQRVTDVWGPTPYAEAGSGNSTVPYDSVEDIYYMMFDELTGAVDALNGLLADTPSLNLFGDNDNIYGGDVSKWVKFANTLRLRMAIRISNVAPAKAKTEAEAAVADKGGMLENNNDDALFSVIELSGEGNGLPRLESFNQDVMSTTMESYMKGYNDPRMQEYWAPVEDSDVANTYPDEYKNNIGGYHGFASGSEPAEYNYFYAFSLYGPRFKDGNQYVTPVNVMNAAETWFLKAEGAWLGWSMGGTAQDFYEKGIEISIKQWRGTSFSTTEITNYINSTATPIAPDNYPYYDEAASDIPVKFSSNSDEQYEQIMTQKWLALYPICFEAWAEVRRTRLPKLYAKKYSVNANVLPSNGQIITRFPFIDREYSGNAEEVEKAIQMIGGADLETIPLWWDTNSNGN